MAVQHEPTLMDAQSPRAAPAQQSPAQQAPPAAPVWLQRMSLIVLVIFCFTIGGFVTALPWWPYYWDHNGWLLAHPTLETILGKGWVRGVVSGLGLLDIWVGISELLHYRDHRA